ncbi:hypothetical protein QUW15_00580 [Desulfovibrio piger]|nr:hypothetical protein [Desulfovibrio piger]
MPDISETTPAALDAELAAARSETVAVSEADYAESLRMAEEIGKVKMAQAISSGLSLGVIRWFASMKESGSYKGRLLIGPDGKTFRPATFEELCGGMGFSYRTVAENLQNFAALGERYLAEAQELGLKVRDMRKVRKALKDAPEETKQEVFAALRDAKDSSEDLKTALDVVCAQLTAAKTETKKIAAQAEKLKKAEEDLRKDYDARGEVLEAKTAQYDELNEKYIRATSPHPSDREAQKLARNGAAREELDRMSNEALLAVARLAACGATVLSDEDMEEDTLAYVHQRISLAVKGMAAAILDNGIDVDLSAEFSVDFGEDEPVEGNDTGTIND